MAGRRPAGRPVGLMVAGTAGIAAMVLAAARFLDNDGAFVHSPRNKQ